MNSPPASPLVASTRHDAALNFIHPAAEEAVVLLIPSAAVVYLADDDATQPELRLRSAATKQYDLAFLCCAGDPNGLFNWIHPYTPADRVPLLDPNDRPLFDDAVLLLNCVEWDHGLARRLVGSTNVNVSAVIGFRPNLSVPAGLIDSGFNAPSARGVPDDVLKCVQGQFRQALLAPLVSLLSDPSVPTAVDCGRRAWRSVGRSLARGCGAPARPFEWLARANANALQQW